MGIALIFFLSEPTLGLAEVVRGTTQQGYPFISGGVGTEERNQMLQNADQYDLELFFAANSGDYLSDVKIIVKDEHGNEVINTSAAGPLFYAELPAGRYDVKAIFGNHTQESKNIQVQNGRRVSRLFHWNVADQTE
jgi:hypothetical protein